MYTYLQALQNPTTDRPFLEVLQLIAQPVAERLKLHFASGRSTDRVDKPEWLFHTALRLARELSPWFEALQPALEKHHLQHLYRLPFEFARAIRAAVYLLLKEHLLPRLEAQVSA